MLLAPEVVTEQEVTGRGGRAPACPCLVCRHFALAIVIDEDGSSVKGRCSRKELFYVPARGHTVSFSFKQLLLSPCIRCAGRFPDLSIVMLRFIFAIARETKPFAYPATLPSLPLSYRSRCFLAAALVL